MAALVCKEVGHAKGWEHFFRGLFGKSAGVPKVSLLSLPAREHQGRPCMKENTGDMKTSRSHVRLESELS